MKRTKNTPKSTRPAGPTAMKPNTAAKMGISRKVTAQVSISLSEQAPCRVSICLDARGVDHARPARELALHELAQALGRAADRRHALPREELANALVFQKKVQFGIELA